MGATWGAYPGAKHKVQKTKYSKVQLESTLAATQRELAAAVEAKTAADAEIQRVSTAPTATTRDVNVMSGNHLKCGFCYTEFNNDDPSGDAARHVFWPCQHARQCGECALKIWKTPKQRRRCPWCAAKIESRPRPFQPFV